MEERSDLILAIEKKISQIYDHHHFSIKKLKSLDDSLKKVLLKHFSLKINSQGEYIIDWDEYE